MSELQEALTNLRLAAQGPRYHAGDPPVACIVRVDLRDLQTVLGSFTETRILQEVSTHRPTGYILGEVPPPSYIKLVWDVVRTDGAVYEVEERLMFVDSAQGAAAAEMLEAMVMDKVERPYSRDPNPDMRPLLAHPAMSGALAVAREMASKGGNVIPMTEDPVDQVVNRLAAVLADALTCFWNAAIDSVRNSRAETSFAVVGAVAEGVNAIAVRLGEYAADQKEKPHG